MGIERNIEFLLNTIIYDKKSNTIEPTYHSINSIIFKYNLPCNPKLIQELDKKYNQWKIENPNVKTVFDSQKIF